MEKFVKTIVRPPNGDEKSEHRKRADSGSESEERLQKMFEKLGEKR